MIVSLFAAYMKQVLTSFAKFTVRPQVSKILRVNNLTLGISLLNPLSLSLPVELRRVYIHRSIYRLRSDQLRYNSAEFVSNGWPANRKLLSAARLTRPIYVLIIMTRPFV